MLEAFKDYNEDLKILLLRYVDIFYHKTNCAKHNFASGPAVAANYSSTEPWGRGLLDEHALNFLITTAFSKKYSIVCHINKFKLSNKSKFLEIRTSSYNTDLWKQPRNVAKLSGFLNKIKSTLLLTSSLPFYYLTSL